MINKNISIWRGSTTPPTNYHLWEKEDGGLYVYLDEKWHHLVTPADKIILDEHQQQLDKIKNLALTEIDPIDTNTYKSYQLKSDDNVFGTTINIPKDRFIKQVTLGYDNATIDESTGIITIGTGLSKEYLLFSVALESGSYELVSINLTNFLTEKDYSDGLEVVDNKLKVKVDPSSEEYLEVSNNGIKVEGINTKVSDTVEDIKNKIQNGEWLPLKRGRKSDGTFVDDCVAMGYQSEATGYGSTAMGYNCKASGNTAHAENAGNKAEGDNSHAEGYICIASGYASHAEGDTCTASAWASHAEGYQTTASGQISHAEGQNCIAEGKNSHAEGQNCTANGENSHAEGYHTNVVGNNSHAEGYYCTASGKQSHVEGEHCTASGYASHAEGEYCTASGTCSHAEGDTCTVSGRYAHAQGYCNYDNLSFIDMVGVGSSSSSSKKNASAIYVGRTSNNKINISDPKNGYQYLIDVGGYKGQEIGNAKSVQEVFADLENNKVDKTDITTITDGEIDEMFN